MSTPVRRRRVAWLIALVLAGGLVWDLQRPPARQVSVRAITALVGVYQRTLSGKLPTRCRFHPTCSRYAVIAVRKHGALEGSWLTVRRISRCGPWTEQGTVDFP